jgi:hypothetical protein
VGPEAIAEIKGLVLAHGRPVKDEDWGDDWRDYDWDHSGNGCAGWEETSQSEIVVVPFPGGTLLTVTHCRCACRVHPHVTVGVEGTLG